MWLVSAALDDRQGSDALNAPPVASLDCGNGDLDSSVALPVFRPASLWDVRHGHHDYLGALNVQFFKLLERYGRACNVADEFWCMQASIGPESIGDFLLTCFS